jgi:hypothetical protein
MAAADTAALKGAADRISRRAKLISSTFSRRIPAATHVAVNNGMVAVVTDGSGAPNAAPFEAGELHPLWAAVGSWRYLHYKWGKQPLRPYMIEAAVSELNAAAEAYGQSIYAYAIARGFKPA